MPLVLMLGCAGSAPRSTTGTSAAALPVLHRQDVLWLERISFGLDSANVAEYHRLGRERYLDRQLMGLEPALPAGLAAELHGPEEGQSDPERALADANAQYKAINAMADGADKELARKSLNERANKLAYEAARRELLRALYSPAQLKEQMVWFWLNHFSVYQAKANLRWLVADYADRAIRPHALGHFKDLVLATLEHPAMLQYLDNSQNALGHVNENYARELMELHTLGVDAGYTQQDVQQLARVLTGTGVNAGNPPKLKPQWQALYRREGAFEFNPARHDFGDKVLLEHTIRGRGFAEVEEAVSLIVSQPACARFVSRRLATYFVADDPPPALVARMARTFTRTDGDIAAVLREMFLSPELDAALGAKFKDPMRFVVSAVRLAYDGRTITNARPLLSWLNGLGEAPFSRQTPDGFPLTETSWASSGQISRRFEIARAIGSGSAGLFDAEGGGAAGGGFPQLSNRLYFEAAEPFLASNTRIALARANSPQEWNTLLLASPDFNYE
ncbi:MAG TPA: DUF1800 domain-containing protein [Steroidobacteraceae bacterium]|nr:DUF1800 domain-containing protein [Steroidobacteraceae bacterium]